MMLLLARDITAYNLNIRMADREGSVTSLPVKNRLVPETHRASSPWRLP